MIEYVAFLYVDQQTSVKSEIRAVYMKTGIQKIIGGSQMISILGFYHPCRYNVANCLNDFLITSAVLRVHLTSSLLFLDAEAEEGEVVEAGVVGTEGAQHRRQFFDAATVVAAAVEESQLPRGVADMHVERDVELALRY